MGCLYKLDFPNGKSYVGITKLSAENRFVGHIQGATRKGAATLCGRAIRKYGAAIQVRHAYGQCLREKRECSLIA